MKNAALLRGERGRGRLAQMPEERGSSVSAGCPPPPQPQRDPPPACSSQHG